MKTQLYEPLALILLIAIPAIALTSCDPGYGVTGKINNTSSDTVVVKQKIERRDTIIFIPPHSIVDISLETGIGGYSKTPCCCTVQNDSIFLSVTDTARQVTKDIRLIDNWQRTITQKKIMSTSIDCIFSITESDIQ